MQCYSCDAKQNFITPVLCGHVDTHYFQDFLIKLNEQHLSNILHLLMHLIQK